MTLRRRLIICVLGLAVAHTAWASPACYLRAQNDQSSHGKKLVTAGRWISMSPAERQSAGHVWIVNAVDSHTCSKEEVLPGGELIDQKPISVPFGDLYASLAHAIADKDVDRIQYINAHAKPANKDLDALVAMYEMPPPSSAGGWARFKTISQVFQVPTPSSQWLQYGLMDLFKVMGGQAVENCQTHNLPLPHATADMKPADYRHVLARFDLQMGPIHNNHNDGTSRSFTLEGCTQ